MTQGETGASAALAAAALHAGGYAFYELGLLHASGRGAPADLVEAHKWFNIAVARGCREAAAARAELAMEMSPAEIAAAQREARIWLTRH